MSVAIVVPARYASSRYPAKPLAILRGATGVDKPLVRRSCEAATAVAGVAQVVVATDDRRIADAVHAFGGYAVMTPQSCINGTERCAAALDSLPPDTEIIVNLQGDAPLTPPSAVEALVQALIDDPELMAATPAVVADGRTHRRLLEDRQAGRVGGTTVVRNAAGDALYFSKAVIPHVPDDRIGDPAAPVLLHLGVYAYRRAALERYAALEPSPLEMLEGLEQLRFLHAGVPVRVVEVDTGGLDVWELNNPGDRAPIEAALMARGIE